MLLLQSVVSALADPDTVRVHRDISGKITVNQVDIGKKNVKIIMDGRLSSIISIRLIENCCY